jgi:hypothetical protein
VFQAGIELDPASCDLANKVVQAKRFYTIDDDGLTRPWNAATVFLNPPYGKLKGKSQAGVWLQKLISEYKSGNVREAILLVNASTSESWFQSLYDYPICFTNHRIPFWSQDGKGKAPTKGNVFTYFGKNVDRFASVFEAANVGTVLIRYRPLTCTEDIAPKLFYTNVQHSSTNSVDLNEHPDGYPAGEEAANLE